MKKIYHRLQQLKDFISFSDMVNPLVSNASVGWHIQHSLMVINEVSNALLHCDLPAYKSKYSFAKTYVLVLGIIPRGKVNAPRMVTPAGDITKEILLANANDTSALLASLASVSPSAYFTHPMFGHIKLRRGLRFLSIHTHHHLKIISDILLH